MAQANIDASRRLIEEAFSEGRLELLDELCADGFVSHDPLAGDQDVEMHVPARCLSRRSAMFPSS